MSTVKIESNAGGSGTFTIASPNSNNTRTLTLPDEAGTILASGGALGTPSSGVVTNLTGTASININGTVGATTPSTGAFTTLTTSSTVTHNGGTANGVAFLNASKVLTTGSALTFDGTNLGVGNVNPTTGLVPGLVIGNGTDNKGITLFGTSTTQQNIAFTDTASAQQGLLQYDHSVNAMRFFTNSVECMRIDSAGNVGIGTLANAPVYQQQVFGSGQQTANLTDAGNKGGSLLLNTPTVTGGDGGALLIGAGGAGAKPFTAIKGLLTDGAGNTTGHLAFSTRNLTTDVALTERMRLDSSGNVGIGTSSPEARLTVIKDLTSGGDATGFRLNANTTADRNILFGGPSTSLDASFWQSYKEGTGNGERSLLLNPLGGNVGIGTSSPGAKLEVNQAGAAFPGLKLTGSNSPGMQIVEATGVTAHFVNDSAGVYVGSTTSHPLVLRTNNTEHVRITSVGNVGIGTSSPAAKLHVNAADGVTGVAIIGGGNLNVSAIGEINAQLDFRSNDGSVNNTNNIAGRIASVTEFSNGANVGLAFSTFQQGAATPLSEKLRITNNGDVGIGTSSPTEKLEVFGTNPVSRVLATQASTPKIRLSETNIGNIDIFKPTGTSDLVFSMDASATQAMRITSAGNVGIGMTPTNFGNGYTVLQVANASNGGMLYLTDTANAGGRIFGNAAGLNFESFSTTFQAFSTNGSERVRIDSSGNLLVGATSLTSSERLLVQKSNANGYVGAFNNTNNASGDQSIYSRLGTNANNTSSFHFIANIGNTTDKLYIFGNGNVVNSNNSYGQLSDVKLKENIVDAKPKLAEVMQLKVRNFNFKTEPNNKQIGFIAQELEEIFPSLIDNTASPNDKDNFIKSIKTSVLIPILTKAIQEQQALITALTARITALESN